MNDAKATVRLIEGGKFEAGFSPLVPAGVKLPSEALPPTPDSDVVDPMDDVSGPSPEGLPEVMTSKKIPMRPGDVGAPEPSNVLGIDELMSGGKGPAPGPVVGPVRGEDGECLRFVEYMRLAGLDTLRAAVAESDGLELFEVSWGRLGNETGGGRGGKAGKEG